MSEEDKPELEATSTENTEEETEVLNEEVEETAPKKEWSILNPEISAVIALNGKQYPVKVGEKCTILDLSISEEDESKSISSVLLGKGKKTIIGDPYIKNASVVLQPQRVVSQKLINFKKRRRKNQSKRTKGYRQYSTVFLTQSITIPGLPESRIEEASAKS